MSANFAKLITAAQEKEAREWLDGWINGGSFHTNPNIGRTLLALLDRPTLPHPASVAAFALVNTIECAAPRLTVYEAKGIYAALWERLQPKPRTRTVWNAICENEHHGAVVRIEDGTRSDVVAQVREALLNHADICSVIISSREVSE